MILIKYDLNQFIACWEKLNSFNLCRSILWFCDQYQMLYWDLKYRTYHIAII